SMTRIARNMSQTQFCMPLHTQRNGGKRWGMQFKKYYKNYYVSVYCLHFFVNSSVSARSRLPVIVPNQIRTRKAPLPLLARNISVRRGISFPPCGMSGAGEDVMAAALRIDMAPWC
ncbi:MAG: hypothetical protein KGJ57_11950, partial [Sphingomonadales bacterium]|nr:hypothetical protein [Sphingomonadales bacterium]